jgi:hypothetical protein
MNFEGDGFISYAHLDNVGLIEGGKGWVSRFHRALEVRVGQFLGKPPQFYRDPKLRGNDFFGDALLERLRHVATLVSVVSPRYLKSEWTRKELSEFWKAADQQGDVFLHDKARIFKVIKTPVPLDMYPPELQTILGYEFFKVDPDTGKVHELDEIFGPEAQRDFWLKLDDLAHDICCLLETLQGPVAEPVEEKGAVYLAVTTLDLKEEREEIKRDLQQHGYMVFPDRQLPLVASEAQTMIREDLTQCQMSIHLIGKSYGAVPEGGEESLLVIQNELAIQRCAQGDFSRLLWIPPGLRVEDERQCKFIEQLRMDSRVPKGSDLMETPLDDLRTVCQERLKDAKKPAHKLSGLTADAESFARLYLIYDSRDAEIASPWAEFLFEQGLEVIRPLFEGDEAEIRSYHEENLCNCDGALILYGSANECWLRRKLRELQKSAGYDRSRSMPVVAISLLPPRTAAKEQFRTHEATVIPQFDGFSPDPLKDFAFRLKVA